MLSHCSESAYTAFSWLSAGHRFRGATIRNGLWRRPYVEAAGSPAKVVAQMFVRKDVEESQVLGFGFRASDFGDRELGHGFLAAEVCRPPLQP